jgi:6-phosphogluconate dehydrogenase (decarboxylating)
MIGLGRMGANMAERLVRGATQINYVDSGTSGGIWGLKEGHSMMLGGSAAVVERLKPNFETPAPGPKQSWGRGGHAQPVRRSRNQERVSPRQ